MTTDADETAEALIAAVAKRRSATRTARDAWQERALAAIAIVMTTVVLFGVARELAALL